MSLFDNLNKRTEQEYQGIETTDKTSIRDLVSEISTIFGGFGATPKRKIKELLNSATGWVYACVDAIANEIATIEILLFKQKANGEVEKVDNHEVLDLLARANNNTTHFDLFYLTQQYLDLAGEAPWFLEFVDGKPVNILLLRPDLLTVLPPKKEGELIGGYKYQVNNRGVQEITLESFEVIFLKYPDPTKVLRGKGTLEAAITTFEIDQTSERFNLKFFTNSATPDSVLSTEKKLSREVVTKLKRELSKKHEGFENSHKTLVLEGGLEWKPMTMSQREMDFIEGMKFTRDKILAIFRVPKSVLGLTEDVNRANAEAGDFVFAKRTVKPKMQKLVEMLNEFLIPFYDDSGELFLDYVDPVPENLEHKLKLATEGVTKGVLTVNESRELLGYDAIEGGDDVLAPATPNVPAERMAGKVSGKKPKGKAKKYNPTYIRSNRKRSANKRKVKAITKELIKNIATTATDIAYTSLLSKAQSKKRLKESKEIAKKSYIGSKAQKLAFQDEQLRVGDEFEKRWINKMIVIFREQSNIIVAKLSKKADEDVLLNVEKETDKTIEKLKPLTASVISIQSAKAFQLLGQEGKLTTRNNDAVTKYLDVDIVPRFSEDITVETNRIIGKIIDDGLEQGQSIAQISKNIKTSFKQMEGYRANRIARSEVIRATSFATEETFIVSEVVEAKEWLTFIDERTDEACLALNGKKIGLGKDYFKKGQSTHGVDLNYEDIAGPPLHINCRCTLVPVVIA